jgi:hypothetical protein
MHPTDPKVPVLKLSTLKRVAWPRFGIRGGFEAGDRYAACGVNVPIFGGVIPSRIFSSGSGYFVRIKVRLGIGLSLLNCTMLSEKAL